MAEKIRMGFGEEEGIEAFVEPYDKSFLNSVKRNLSDLVQRVFYDRAVFTASINIERNPEGNYNYNIDYGNAQLSMQQIAKMQEVLRYHADLFHEANPSNKGAKMTYSYVYSELDPLGFRIRLWRYLKNQ